MTNLQRRAPRKAARSEVSSEPVYPYCTAPKSLRRFLEMVPQKPKPPKVTTSTLQVWGLKSGNDASILRVLKAIELLGPNGETTQAYADFMHRDNGPAALGRKIKATYSILFENVSSPEKASSDELANFFNIHSGGSEGTIRFQIDTFKALAAYATFGQSDPLEQVDPPSNGSADVGIATRRSGEPSVRIDLHIHLPENKSKSDYDAIIESIATHLYKQ